MHWRAAKEEDYHIVLRRIRRHRIPTMRTPHQPAFGCRRFYRYTNYTLKGKVSPGNLQYASLHIKKGNRLKALDIFPLL